MPIFLTSSPTIAPGDGFTQALGADGGLDGWGLNTGGQIGDGTTTSRSSAVPVGTDADWTAIGVRLLSTRWVSGATARCGAGAGTHPARSATTPPRSRAGPDTDRRREQRLGDRGRGRLPQRRTAEATARCGPGGRTAYGELGRGDTVGPPRPRAGDRARPGGDDHWAAVACGYYHTLALKEDGTLWAWGRNTYGQLGIGNTTNQTSPVQVGTAADWVAVSGGEHHTLALKSDGSLWAWGRNNGGQVGDGTTTNRTAPKQIGTALRLARRSTAAARTASRLKSDGSLWAWGLNADSQVGDNTTTMRMTPVRLGTANDWAAVAGGGGHSTALKGDGSVYAWGRNGNGQVGDGTTTVKRVPTFIRDLLPPHALHDYDGLWHRSVTAHFTGVGISGGIAQVTYAVDGGTETTLPDETFVVALRTWKRGGNSGVHTVTYSLRDTYGNVMTDSCDVRLDAREPTTRDDAPGDAGGQPISHVGPVTVQLSATDQAGLSGVASTLWSLDGGAWQRARSSR